jgi:hypothetical protein
MQPKTQITPPGVPESFVRPEAPPSPGFSAVSTACAFAPVLFNMLKPCLS